MLLSYAYSDNYYLDTGQECIFVHSVLLGILSV